MTKPTKMDKEKEYKYFVSYALTTETSMLSAGFGFGNIEITTKREIVSIDQVHKMQPGILAKVDPDDKPLSVIVLSFILLEIV